MTENKIRLCVKNKQTKQIKKKKTNKKRGAFEVIVYS